MSRPALTRDTDQGSVVERLAEEMIDRWHRGERPLAEEYLDRAPSVRDDPEVALELIAEELALREEFGLPVSATELAGRFPAWQAQIRALVECHRVLGPPPAPRFPPPGGSLGEFQFVTEIGRGAHGRVYLASQPALGGRPVVVKLGPPTGHEHISLARLQHTHIVPLYSAHEFPQHGLRGLCMPDFGGATLADVLRRTTPPDQTATSHPVLRQAGASAPAPIPPGSASSGLMGADTHLDAVCRIGVCLADALRYAHDRGLLHLDLKPSNVLIAADGTPMLLDFHLARPPLLAGEPAPGWLGGTPGYMAPEHLAAIRAVQRGVAVPAAVDPRADVYSLGVVLTEATHALAPDEGGGVPVGFADILARCIAANPHHRYPTAADLGADLRRHLADLPLRGVANRSLSERWRKWRRRRPLALPLVLATAALATVWGVVVTHSDRQVDRAGTILQESKSLLKNGRYAEASQLAHAGEAMVEGLPFHRELRSRLRESRREAERGQAADELQALCEYGRPLYTAETLTPEQIRTAEDRCREVWVRRELLARVLGDGPNPVPESRWRADLLDLGILTASFGVRTAPPEQTLAAHRRALDTLDQAQALFGPSLVLDLERIPHARAAGLDRLADQAARRVQTSYPRDAWEHLAIGRSALATNDLPRAAAAINRAVELDPRAFWANYYKGACQLRLEHPVEALAAFSACVALAPQSAWCLSNRGLAFAELDRLDSARADFDRALALDPGLGAALVGRAAVHHRAGRHLDALADLRQAAALGVSPAKVEYQKAVVLMALTDLPAAIASLRACLAADPGHRPAQELLARLTARP